MGARKTLSCFRRGTSVCRVGSRRVRLFPARAPLPWIYRTPVMLLSLSRNLVRRLLIESGIPARHIEVIPDGIEIPEHLPRWMSGGSAKDMESCGQ